MAKIKAGTPLSKFAKRLHRLDNKFTVSQVEKILPYWWDEELDHSPGAVQEASFYMAKFLNIDLEGVFDETMPLRFNTASKRWSDASFRPPKRT